MKKINTKKKGFTIVELVIVIAVIGILAAILIPTFINLNNKAKVSNTTSFLKNINTQLAAKEANPDIDDYVFEEKGNRKTIEKMSDGINYADDVMGFNIRKISPFDGNEIVWDMENHRFALIKDRDFSTPVYSEAGLKEVNAQYLHSNQEDAQVDLNAGKNIYLNPEFNTSDGKLTSNGASIDATDNMNITEINIESDGDKDVYVSTNNKNCNVVINTPNADAYHDGIAGKVDLKSVPLNSYHENGTVQLIAVKEGHVELDSRADVNGIYVYTDNASAGFEDIKITVTEGVDIPKLSRSAVEIADEGTKVCTLVTDQAKDVYLFNEGIYEQIKTVDAGKDISDSSAAWADSNVNTANTQTAAQQLANELNATFTVDDTTYAVTVNTETRELVVTNTTTSETVNDTNIIAEATSEAGKTAEEAQAASALKGSGTEADPFLVYDYETMQKISDFYDLGEYYFKVAIEKTDNGHINCDDWESIKLNGSFDGNGIVFDNLDAPLFNRTNSSNISTIGNFTADCNIVSQTGRAAICTNSAFNTLFHDITVTGYIEGQGQTAAVVSYPGSGVTEFKNVNVSADIVSLGDAGAAAFVINPYKLLSGYGGNSNSKLIFDDCHYSGKMSATGTCKFFYVHTTTVPVEIKNINSNEFGGAVNTYNRYALSEQSSVISIVDIDINEVAAGDNFVFDKLSASAVTCTVTIGISPNGTDETGSFTGVYLKDGNIELGDDGKFHTTNAVKITSASVNDNNKVAGLNDLDSNGKFEHYNIISSVYGTTHNGGFVTVIQYDSRGNVVAYASATLFDANN